MRGLVWKELREWGPLTAGILVPLCTLWCMLSTSNSLVVPRAEPSFAVIAVACFFGLALGYGQFSAERIRGTQGYLAHREGGRSALLRSKLTVGVPLALALAMLPPLVGFAWQFSGPLAPIVQPARAFEHALAGLAVLPAYACGLYIALIASNVLVMLLLALIAGFGCFLYSMWLPLPVYQMSFWALPLYAAGQALLGAALLALAWQIFAHGHDRDGVLPLRLQAGSAVFALLLFAFPIHAMVSDGVREGQQQLFNSYPLVVRSFDGRYSLMERAEFHSRIQEPGTERRTYTLPNGAVASELNPSLVYNPSPPVDVPKKLLQQILLRERGSISDVQRWSEVPVGRPNTVPIPCVDKNGRPIVTVATTGHPGSGGSDEWHLDCEEGVVHQFLQLDSRHVFSTDPKAPPPSHTVLRRPDGKPFSRATELVADGMKPSLLVDRGDMTLWTLDFAASGTRLAELELPDGDRLVDLQSKQPWEPEGWSAGYDWEPVLVGARARYQWTAGGFQLENTPPTKPWWLRYCRSEVGEASMAAATVRLRALDENGNVGPDSEVVFVQRYEPRTAGDNGLLALMRVGLQCGPPILSAQTLLLGRSTSLTRGYLPGPYAIPKDTNVFHAIHVAFGLLLGMLAWVHVGRRGGTRGERLLWSLLAALFGLFALLFLVLLAPRPRVVTQVSKSESPSRKPAASLATA